MSKLELILKIWNMTLGTAYFIWLVRLLKNEYKKLKKGFSEEQNRISKKLKEDKFLESCKSGEIISLEGIIGTDIWTLIFTIRKEYPEIEILWLARKKNELSFEVVSEEKADELSETGNYFITPIFISNSL